MKTRITDEIRNIGKALAVKLGVDEGEWCYGPSGFSVKNQAAPVSLAAARKLTGVVATPKAPRVLATTGRGGEWNTLVALTMAVSRAR